MTSAKYYSNWLREAGRGHIAAILTWGGFLFYLVLKIMELSGDTEYNFFGIGSGELYFLCAALGLALAFAEFFYLFQAKKQDFYYSLPVKKSTIFWSRYAHGVVQFFLPFLSVQIICALFEASRDSGFAACAPGYMGRSIGLFLIIFLLFYHIGMLAVVVSGKIFTAVSMGLILLFYAQILVQNIFLNLAGEIYRSFYRIPVMEEAGILFVPGKLAGVLAGIQLFEKKEVFAYVPQGRYIFTAVVWAVLCFILAALAQSRRRPEAAGRIFTSMIAERVTEIMLALLAGLSVGSVVMSGLGAVKKGMIVTGGVLCAGGICGAFLIHVLCERLVQTPQKRLLRRRIQMVLEGVGVCVIALLFVGSRGAFDHYMPEDSKLEKLSVYVKGLDMEESRFVRAGSNEQYFIEERLRQYTMSDDGMRSGMEWLRDLEAGWDQEDTGKSDKEEDGSITTVTVCYQLKDGTKRYRAYPVDEKALEEFSDVYETGEYKKIVYPLTTVESLEQERITWTDGVTETVVRLSEDEKEDLLEAYKADVADMEIKELRTALPAGYIEVESQVSGTYTEAAVYPFFERTSTFLAEHEVIVGRRLADYPVMSLKVKENTEMVTGVTGSVRMRFYDEEEEIAQWLDGLVPVDLAIQPLMNPVDTSVQVEAEVLDESTNSTVIVKCYSSGGME